MFAETIGQLKEQKQEVQATHPESRQTLGLVLHKECFFSHDQKSFETSDLLKFNELCNIFSA